jgi:hypothetical protein
VGRIPGDCEKWPSAIGYQLALTANGWRQTAAKKQKSQCIITSFLRFVYLNLTV